MLNCFFVVLIKQTSLWRQDVRLQTLKMNDLTALIQKKYGKIKLPGTRIFSEKSALCPVSDQNGSIIVIALMVLVIMTVIGLISSDTVVTENFIIRNQAIYKQNVNMVEAAMMIGSQELMQTPNDQLDVDLAGNDWLVPVTDFRDDNSEDNWYSTNHLTRVLQAATSLDLTPSAAIDPLQPLADRGENESNLLVSFVGWETVEYPGGGSESIVAGSSQLKEGRILGEYVSLADGASNGFGMLRMEMGVRQFVIDI
jgi:hypothetical protein